MAMVENPTMGPSSTMTTTSTQATAETLRRPPRRAASRAWTGQITPAGTAATNRAVAMGHTTSAMRTEAVRSRMKKKREAAWFVAMELRLRLRLSGNHLSLLRNGSSATRAARARPALNMGSSPP
jgi:hypothetical protein